MLILLFPPTTSLDMVCCCWSRTWTICDRRPGQQAGQRRIWSLQRQNPNRKSKENVSLSSSSPDWGASSSSPSPDKRPRCPSPEIDWCCRWRTPKELLWIGMRVLVFNDTYGPTNNKWLTTLKDAGYELPELSWSQEGQGRLQLGLVQGRLWSMKMSQSQVSSRSRRPCRNRSLCRSLKCLGCHYSNSLLVDCD